MCISCPSLFEIYSWMFGLPLSLYMVYAIIDSIFSYNNSLVKTILTSLKESPNDWQHQTHICYNPKLGVAIWTANIPILFCHLYHPATKWFSLLNKIRIYNAINKNIDLQLSTKQPKI